MKNLLPAGFAAASFFQAAESLKICMELGNHNGTDPCGGGSGDINAVIIPLVIFLGLPAICCYLCLCYYQCKSLSKEDEQSPLLKP